MKEFLKNTVDKCLKVAGEYMKEVDKLMSEFDNLDDERLLKMYKSLSGQRKAACAMLLKQRGYFQDE